MKRFIAFYSSFEHEDPMVKGLDATNAVDAVIEAFPVIMEDEDEDDDLLSIASYYINSNGDGAPYVLIWDTEKDVEITENWEDYLNS